MSKVYGKLREIRSGGQSGADRTSLEVARELDIKTGGTAPKGYRTEIGQDFSLKDFGLKESPDWNYKSRTWDNVKDADVTIWFGRIGSPGFKCTKAATVYYQKPFFINPLNIPDLAQTYEVWNVAGNRASTNPGVIKLVQDRLRELKSVKDK